MNKICIDYTVVAQFINSFVHFRISEEGIELTKTKYLLVFESNAAIKQRLAER